MCLKRCGYWMCLSGADPTENKETLTISIPRENVFTVNNLKDIMQHIAAGEIL